MNGPTCQLLWTRLLLSKISMKLKEIHRTSTFAWSPSAPLPLLATGTVAGALDESFSNESQLELWAPDFLDKDEFDLGTEGQRGPKGVVTDTARLDRLEFVAGLWRHLTWTPGSTDWHGAMPMQLAPKG